MGDGAEAGESGEVGVEDLKKRRFVLGMLLAWAPSSRDGSTISGIFARAFSAYLSFPCYLSA